MGFKSTGIIINICFNLLKWYENLLLLLSYLNYVFLKATPIVEKVNNKGSWAWDVANMELGLSLTNRKVKSSVSPK